MTATTLKNKPQWPRIGELVNYHSVIGGEATEFNMEVWAGPQLMCGSWVVWLKGKSGCVAVEALTKNR